MCKAYFLTRHWSLRQVSVVLHSASMGLSTIANRQYLRMKPTKKKKIPKSLLIFHRFSLWNSEITFGDSITLSFLLNKIHIRSVHSGDKSTNEKNYLQIKSTGFNRNEDRNAVGHHQTSVGINKTVFNFIACWSNKTHIYFVTFCCWWIIKRQFCAITDRSTIDAGQTTHKFHATLFPIQQILFLFNCVQQQHQIE